MRRKKIIAYTKAPAQTPTDRFFLRPTKQHFLTLFHTFEENFKISEFLAFE
jgi:hypothetical protein